MNLSNLVNSSHFISWDFLMVMAVFAVFVFLGFFWKKKRILTIILALYLARLSLALFSLPNQFENFKSAYLTGNVLCFWALFLFFFFLFVAGGVSLRTTSSKRTSKKKKTRYLALKGLLYGFFAAGLFISLSISLMNIAFIGNLSLIINYLFVLEIAKITWAFLPIIAMIVFK